MLISPHTVFRLMKEKDWQVSTLSDRSEISLDTLRLMRKADASYKANDTTAFALAKALSVSVNVLRCDADGNPLGGGGIDRRIGSWLIKREGESFKAKNGLVWREYELIHFHDDEKARGKAYDLHEPPTKHQVEIENCLKRHRAVAKRIGKHANITFNLDIIHDPEDHLRWWMIDEWISATRLTHLLNRGPLPSGQARDIMRGIAQGLAALHSAGVIRRDLTPSSILVTERSAVLTDFELAKLPTPIPTVSVKANGPKKSIAPPKSMARHGSCRTRTFIAGP